MKHKFLLSTIVFLIFNISFSFATEIAIVSSHYSHPVHNIIEDSGKNPEIGQGMSESVLYPKALLEEENNKIFATFRFNMADQISSFKISTQKYGDDNFKDVPYTVMKTTKKTIDLRFEIMSKNSIVRIVAFVDAMGREVVFYGKIGESVEGSGDFIVSVNESKLQENELEIQQNIIVQEQKNEVIESEEVKEDTNTNENVTDKDSGSDNIFYKDDYEQVGVILKGDSRLEKIGTNGENTDQMINNSELGSFTKIAIYSIYNVFATISVLTFILGILSITLFYSLRKRNDIKEAKLYGFEDKK